MTGNKKNTLTTRTTKPDTIPMPPRPKFSVFKKPDFHGPNFSNSNAFRNQNRGSGGK